MVSVFAVVGMLVVRRLAASETFQLLLFKNDFDTFPTTNTST